MSFINIPDEVASVMEALENAGYEAYAVGGCVRDCLLGLEPHDWDLTTSATPEATMAVFGENAIPTGLQYGTVSVKSGGLVVEVTTFRTDGIYSDNRRPDYIGYASSLSEDLSRRDFTINAIACSLTGEIIDPYNGQRDLKNMLIRAVGVPKERFEEDALRMFRGLRIAARLGFSIHPNTFSAIYEKAHLAAFLSAERIKDELQKFLVCPNTYMINCIFESGLMQSFGIGSTSPDFENLAELPTSGYARISAMCYALEKDKCISSPHMFLEDLHYDRHTIKMADDVCSLLDAGLPATAAQWKKLLSLHGEQVCQTAATVARVLENYDCGVLQQVIDSGECWSARDLAVNGNDLKEIGYRGKALGAELKKLVAHVIEKPGDNRRDILLAMAKAGIA